MIESQFSQLSINNKTSFVSQKNHRYLWDSLLAAWGKQDNYFERCEEIKHLGAVRVVILAIKVDVNASCITQ